MERFWFINKHATCLFVYLYVTFIRAWFLLYYVIHYIFYPGISQINEIMALSGCDVIIPWTYRMSFVKVEWFAGNDTTGKNMMTYLPDSGKVEVFPLYSVKFYNVTDSIGMILPNTTTNSAYTVKVTVNSFTTEDTTTSVILQEGNLFKC